MNSGWPSSTISTARLPAQKRGDFLVDQRIGDVQHVERQLGCCRTHRPCRQSSSARSSVLYRPPCTMMPTSPVASAHEFVQAMLADEVDAPPASAAGSSPARAAKLAGGSTIRDTSRTGCSIASCNRERGRTLSLARKRPCTWQARMRNSSITGVWDASDSSNPCSTISTMLGKIGPRVEQPDLRLHRKGVRALLHDGGAFAVVLADDDQRAAGDAAGSDVGERIGGHVGADRRFPGDGAANRIVHRGGQRGGGGGLRGARLEMHAQFLEHALASDSTSIRCEIGAPW